MKEETTKKERDRPAPVSGIIMFFLILVLTFCFNPFMLNVFSHPYQLDESISNFRVVGWYFSFLFKF